MCFWVFQMTVYLSSWHLLENSTEGQFRKTCLERTGVKSKPVVGTTLHNSCTTYNSTILTLDTQTQHNSTTAVVQFVQSVKCKV